MGKQQIKDVIKGIPIICGLSTKIHRLMLKYSFTNSQNYWESNYANGRTSGDGSYGILANFKAEVLNSFVRENNITSVMEFGCGDGNQLSLSTYSSYIGLDVSKTAIQFCKKRFHHDKTKSFFLYHSSCFEDNHLIFKAELVLSLDVIFHLVEDEIFESYMQHLFSASKRYVIIYSSDNQNDENIPHPPHFKERQFSSWVEANCHEWYLIKKIPNKYPFQNDTTSGSISNFFIFQLR